MTNKQLLAAIKKSPARSAWAKGVRLYAIDLVKEAIENDTPLTPANYKQKLLNGADNWLQYSEGGSSLIYNGDIAKRLCNATELKKVGYDKRNETVERNPNSREDWLDVQARALRQAQMLIGEYLRKPAPAKKVAKKPTRKTTKR